jgi:Tfp pilus assembly protein PilF
MQSVAQPQFQQFSNKKYLVLAALAIIILLVLVVWSTSRKDSSDKPAPTAQQLRTDSFKAYKKGDYKLSTKNFAAYIEKAPKDKEALNMLASSYSLIGDSVKAIESLKALQKLQPNDSDILYRLALLSKNLKKTPDEIMYFNQLLKIKPDMIQARLILADEYAAQKEYDLAVSQYEILLGQILKDDKVRTSIYTKLGDTYKSKNEISKAKKSYKEGLKIDPADKELKTRLSETTR